MFLQKKILKVATDPQYTIYVGYYLYHKEHTEQLKQEIQFRIVSFFKKTEAGPGRPRYIKGYTDDNH